ncbi:MAG: LAGLIDADG family homing endonuclease [Candidatus Aenigmarchaeota archaeon]|nr:LAGLIDADG family homing endonuclease [Candidatus Aenigmarchaeota archaeon]
MHVNERRMSRFIGYLFSDGSLRRKKNKMGIEQVEVSIECADLAIVQDFRQLCSDILGRNVGKITKRKRDKNWRASYSFYCKLNKEWRKFLFSMSPTFRTSPCLVNLHGGKLCQKCLTKHYKDTTYPGIKIPRFVYKSNNNIKDFLQAFTNSEGSVQLRANRHGKWLEFSRHIKISTEHPLLLKGISRMLKTLKINHRFVPKTNPNSVIIQQKESIKKFRKLIGFMGGIRITPTGIWGNYEKTKILDAIIKTFDFDRGFLQTFLDDNEIYSFIKVNHLPDMASEICRIESLK